MSTLGILKTGLIGLTLGVPLGVNNKAVAEEQVAPVEQGYQLPAPFDKYDFNGRDGLDTLSEQYECFYAIARWPRGIDENKDRQLSRKELVPVLAWYKELSKLERLSEEQRKVVAAAAVDLENFLNEMDEQGIAAMYVPLPNLFASSDIDGDRQINFNEALKFYETQNNIVLNRNEQGQVSQEDLQKVIDFYVELSSKLHRGNVFDYAASTCYDARKTLMAAHAETFGSEYPRGRNVAGDILFWSPPKAEAQVENK